MLRCARRSQASRRKRPHVEILEDRRLPSITLGQQPGAPNNTQFHGDSSRTGFNSVETVLTPTTVASSFGQVWQSPVLDGAVYATPLYLDSLLISGPGNAANHAGDGVQNASYQNQTLGVAFAATGGGTVYAIAAQDTNGPTGIAPGTILWKTHLGNPYAGVDGNNIGVLSTPVIDLKSGRLYVTASVTDYLTAPGTPNHGGNNFEVFALSLHDGSLIAGWPLIFTQSLLDSLNQNTLQGPGIAVPFSSSGADQRGALNLSPDGSTLYVDWACYGASNPGWMTTVATGVTNGVSNGQSPAIVSAYSSVDTTATNANGGMWGAGGPSIDASGNVFVTTGDSPGGTGNPAGDWGNSVLEFGPGQTLKLTGVYTPWNYPTQDTIDSDLGGGSPILINLPAGSSTTTELAAFGGKQGNGYLVDAGNNLNNPTPNPNNSPASYPASLTARPPGNETPDQDASLYDTTSTGVRNYWVGYPPQDGPLSLFGPYNESSASGNTAKARDTPATFTGPDGSQYVIFAGATKSGVGSSTPVAPSLIVTKIIASPGQPAYLQIVSENSQVMSNPGSNLITGNGTSSEIDWVVDAGVQRTDSLTSFSNGAPVLYAFNPLTMQPIWGSAYEELNMGGKYNSIAVARGDVFIGTNRLQAFGLTSDTIVDDSVTGTGANQFNYVGAGWTHITGGSTMGTFDGTVSTDGVQGDYATLTFTGSQIKVYANEVTGYGTATFSVDGATTRTVMLAPSNSSPNGAGAGDVLVYTVSGLAAGTHTFEILNNAASNTIAIDRVEITPPTGAPAKLGISMTDGNIIPSAGGVVAYTINYNNAGSVVNNTGTGATGVVLTETVPANTTADLSNSTPGWTRTSGTGGAGSTYTFTVGSLPAGVTGSAVFSVDLNASIPAGTTSISDTATIADGAGDTSGGSRSTPIPPAAETKLVFTVEPPATGSAGIALSPTIMVTAEDQFNNPFTADNASTVTLTLSSGTFAGGATTATAQVSNGVATFSSLVLTAAGTYTLTATDGLLASATSSAFTIAASSKLAFVQQPTQTVAGVAISPAVTVAVENAGGTVITSDSSVITLTLSTGSFANGSTTVSAQTQSGVATFSNLVIDAASSYNLTATDGTLTPAQSNPFNIVAQATQLVFSQQPNNTYAGEAVNPSGAVSLEDGFGNLDTSNLTPVTLALSTGTFFGGATSAAAVPVNGVASFNNLVVTTPGTYTLTATAGGLRSATSYSFTIATTALTTIDDNNANNTGTIPQVVYSNPTVNWVQSPSSLPNDFGGTITSDSTGGDTATVTFTGTLITLYAALSTTGGAAQIFIDGNAPTQVNLGSSTAAIAPVYTSPLLTAGSHTIVVKVVSGTVSIDDFVVGPATPTLAWATPANLTYGTALDGTELDAFVSNYAGFAGTFAYTPPAGTVLAVGQNEPLTVTFTPADTADYDTASAEVLISVAKATPVITWTGPATDMTYGQALGPNQLNATATVNGKTIAGTFAYTPPAGTVPHTGQNYPLSVTFTPADPADYNTVTAQSDVDVDPANPVITWPNPADIIDGTPLGSAQLDATANVAGIFTYSPPAGTILAPGQQQALGVVFTPTDSTDYNVVGATAYLNVDYGPAAKLAFKLQPGNTTSGTIITPAVTVAVEDSAGSTLPGDTSTVTLTLSGGTFTGGGNTVTAQAVSGVATFSTLAISNNGVYTLTASDGSLPASVSNTFTIGASAFDNFNSGASSFTGAFATNNSGVAGGTALNWSATAGVGDQAGGAPGGGIVAGVADETAVYTPTSFNVSDGAVHTVSEFLTAATGYPAGDRLLQIGFVTASTAGFNAGFSFISARIYGNDQVEFQSGNGSGTTAVSIDKTAPTGTIAGNDWLQLVFTTQETSSGSFKGTFSLLDYGPTGTAAPTLVLAPVSYTVSGLTTIGTAAAMYGGFRTANSGGTSALKFDNFLVDSSAAKMAYLQQPSIGTAGAPLGSFVAAVEDINSNILVGDTSTVTLILSHGTFSNGQASVTAQAVDGIATFNNLVISAAGSYILRATDTNPNLDPGYAPFTINAPASPAKLAFLQQPSTATAGVTIAPAVTVAVEDASGNTVGTDTSTVTLTLSSGTFASGSSTASASAVAGVATFSDLVINAAGTYTLAASDGTLTGTTSGSFTINPGASAKLAFLQPPTSASAGATITPAVTVCILDANGNKVTGNTSTVTLTLSSGTFASGSSTATASAVAGVATFGSLVINAASTYMITASDGTLTPATSSSFTISPTAAAKLAFMQQPTSANTGATITPAVTVAIEDASGNTITANTSTVTLTLSSGTFASGSNTATASAVAGVATFGSLVMNAAGTYTLAASDDSLAGATSSAFTIGSGASFSDNFNAGATTFTSNFKVYNNGGANSTSLSWGASYGVQDQPGPAAGGGVESSGSVAIDTTAIYTPVTVNLSDGQVHTLSEYVTAVSGLGSGDKPLQVGYLAPTSTGFNAGFSFISARILGNNTVEFQYDNGGTATSIDNTKPTGTITTGDWLKLIFTTQETASGSFKGTFSLVDYGPTGVAAGTTVLAPVSYTISGLTNLGTASAVLPGFRTATNSTFKGHVQFDNFSDPSSAPRPGPSLPHGGAVLSGMFSGRPAATTDNPPAVAGPWVPTEPNHQEWVRTSVLKIIVRHVKAALAQW
jgi:hypothetical protein